MGCILPIYRQLEKKMVKSQQDIKRRDQRSKINLGSIMTRMHQWCHPPLSQKPAQGHMVVFHHEIFLLQDKHLIQLFFRPHTPTQHATDLLPNSKNRRKALKMMKKAILKAGLKTSIIILAPYPILRIWRTTVTKRSNKPIRMLHSKTRN